MQESEIARSRERSQNAENRRSLKNATKNHIDMKVKKVTTARKQAFNNSTLRQFSQFERVQMKTTMSDEMMKSKTVLAVHRADSASRRERGRARQRTRQETRTIISSGTTRSRTRTSSVERDLVDTLKQMMLNAKMLSIVFVSSS
jgi:hypothetical protein